MTTEKLKEELLKIGVDPDSPSWAKTRSADLGKLPFIQQQRESLQKVADLLEAQVKSDEDQIQSLRETHSRLKRGGGR